MAGVESIALPFHCAVMPGKMGSICASSCCVNVVTAGFVAFVVYGFDCASDFETFRNDPSRHPAAVEYVGGSVTTPGRDLVESEVEAKNPWNRQYNGANHGYALVAASGAQLVTQFRRSDVLDPNGGTAPFELFVQPDGANSPSRQSLPAPV